MAASDAPSPKRSSDEPIRLAPESSIRTPALPGFVIAGETPERVHELIAADMIAHALNCVRTFGDFHLALSGGSTPIPLYERLMTDPNYRIMPWRRTHLWIVDERCVPFDDDRSNFRHIRESVGDHSGIPPAQVHPIPATEPDASALYEETLRETLGWRERGQDRLDFVLLGMGDNGHTASLFPETSVLEEREHLVAECVGPEVKPRRITMTYPLINASRFVAVLVIGAGKAEMIRRVAMGSETYRELPIKGIRPAAGELHWYLDRAAAGDADRAASKAR